MTKDKAKAQLVGELMSRYKHMTDLEAYDLVERFEHVIKPNLPVGANFIRLEDAALAASLDLGLGTSYGTSYRHRGTPTSLSVPRRRR